VRYGVQRLNRVERIQRGASKRREMENDIGAAHGIDRALDGVIIAAYIRLDKRDVRRGLIPREVSSKAAAQIVDAEHGITAPRIRLREMRAKKACGAGDDHVHGCVIP